MGVKGIRGKCVLVTGGSSGIGQATAVGLAREGANVAINYISSREGAQETEEEIKTVRDCIDEMKSCDVRVTLIKADVSKEHDVADMFTTVIRELGGLDIVVNNAGIQSESPSEDVDVDDFDRIMGVNLRGAFLCAREAIRDFLRNGTRGVIINVSSVHQLIPKPRYLTYSLSKGGMGNLTRTLALEYAARGIRVNGVAPGATVTPINRAWIDDANKRRMVESHIPMRRAGEADEMAAAVAFLCSDEAAYITGQTLYVDGGLTLYPDFETPWSSD